MSRGPHASAFTPHNHAACIGGRLRDAEDTCRERNLRLTPIRRRVLEILLEEHRALGAYDILARLGDEGTPAQPPVAYRALDFLVAHGLAHKIQRMNAFIACAHPHDDHMPAFLICRICRAVAEADSTPAVAALSAAAREAGFKMDRAAMEAEGLCPACCEGDPV